MLIDLKETIPLGRRLFEYQGMFGLTAPPYLSTVYPDGKKECA